MQFFVGIDVSLENSSICVIDERGVVIKEGTAPSDPEAIGRFIRHQGRKVEHVGLETGSLSQWLHAGLTRQGFKVSVMEARHVHAAFGAMRVKTDRNDARGLAQLVRLGWFKSVHVKAPSAQETRALLNARQFLVDKVTGIENSMRANLRNFGLKMCGVEEDLADACSRIGQRHPSVGVAGRGFASGARCSAPGTAHFGSQATGNSTRRPGRADPHDGAWRWRHRSADLSQRDRRPEPLQAVQRCGPVARVDADALPVRPDRQVRPCHKGWRRLGQDGAIRGGNDAPRTGREMVRAKELGPAGRTPERDEEGARCCGTKARRHAAQHVADTITLRLGSRERVGAHPKRDTACYEAGSR